MQRRVRAIIHEKDGVIKSFQVCFSFFLLQKLQNNCKKMLLRIDYIFYSIPDQTSNN